MLEFKVSGQTLTRIDSFRPAEKSRGYLTAKFCLSSNEWKSGALQARVKNRQDFVVYEAEIINDQCLIPWEALAKSGVMQISVFMKNGDVEITTNFVDVGISSTLPSGTESNPPTPSELDQIKQQISDLNERVDNLDQDGGDVDLTGYATEEWVKDQKYLTQVPDGYAKTEDIPTDEHIIELIEENAPDSSGGIAVTGAKVGQTVKITEVDETGKPTAWEAVDFPVSGGNVDLSITGATAGQTVKISAVDENGVPTAWEAVEFPSNEKAEFELIERIVCDGTVSAYIKSGLALKEVEIYIQTEAAEKAASVGVELRNDAALFGYAWIGNLINTGIRYAYVHGVSNGSGNAYIEHTAPASSPYTATAMSRTPAKYDGTTFIKRVNVYGAGGVLLPENSIIEIWGIQA